MTALFEFYSQRWLSTLALTSRLGSTDACRQAFLSNAWQRCYVGAQHKIVCPGGCIGVIQTVAEVKSDQSILDVYGCRAGVGASRTGRGLSGSSRDESLSKISFPCDPPQDPGSPTMPAQTRYPGLVRHHTVTPRKRPHLYEPGSSADKTGIGSNLDGGRDFASAQPDSPTYTSRDRGVIFSCCTGHTHWE